MLLGFKAGDECNATAFIRKGAENVCGPCQSTAACSDVIMNMEKQQLYPS